ncbi:MAG: bifunctional hydroxymethylpyrimidine kinase/phosphomethylpyrimidine kinase [Lewinellaceae bacterium]|nr:bifunctional hydroxymethylpyrimidine kinase/phosphomethylpyrimidine kinase [Lewinellaceae bacterium]
MSLLTVGTVAFDDIETPLGKADKIVGGACTYISLAASYFVKHINLVSVIGDDFPQETLDLLKSKGVNLEGLQIKEGEKSFFWAGKYHDDLNSRDTLDTQLNVLADFDPVLPASYQHSDFVMLGNLTPAVQMRVIEQMNGTPRFIAMDTMNFWMDIALDGLKEVLKKVDCLVVNDEEAKQLSGERSLVKAAEKIIAMGPKYLVIKKGEHGALLFYDDNIFFAPALPLAEVFDPTGAGDTFAGGFIGYLAQSGDLTFENMKRAVIFGSAMASFCVEKFGIERMKNLTHLEIKERVARFVDLVNFDAQL